MLIITCCFSISNAFFVVFVSNKTKVTEKSIWEILKMFNEINYRNLFTIISTLRKVEENRSESLLILHV